MADEERKKAWADYMREWTRRNADRVNALRRERHKKNPERKRKADKSYRDRNLETVRARDRERSKGNETKAAQIRRWHKQNPEKSKASSQRRGKRWRAKHIEQVRMKLRVSHALGVDYKAITSLPKELIELVETNYQLGKEIQNATKHK